VLKLGAALADETRCPVEFLLDGAVVARRELTGAGEVEVELELPAGRSTLTLLIPADPDDDRYGADPRPAMLYITNLRFSTPGP
jgi:hypothetical protein